MKVFPVTKSDDICDEYRVFINGKEYDVDTCRVSKEPFNRRWPGHQRQIEQSELAGFMLMETDEPLDFEIITKRDFEKVEIRPRSLGITPKIEDGKIKFRLEKPAYFTVEPFGRHNALHIFADKPTEYNIDKNDENVIYYGKGVHEVGFIHLKSNQTLYLDEGAVVYACIRAIDAENIKILGKGILDNSHNKEKILFEVNANDNFADVGNAKREHTVQIEFCKNIEIAGITIRDSLVYNIRPIGCENLDIHNVKIIGNWRFNSDGIDMHNCKNVHIWECFIRTFDDSICVKGFDYYGAYKIQDGRDGLEHNGIRYEDFENVLVEKCVIWNDWGKCLEIGAETQAERIFDVVFTDCDVIHAQGPVLDCDNVDYADVFNITYKNINVEFDDIMPQGKLQKRDEDKYCDEDLDPDCTVPLICVQVMYHAEYSADANRRGKNHNLRFENIHVYGRQQLLAIIEGYDENSKCSDIVIDGVYKNGKRVKSLDEFEYIHNEFVENIVLK